MTSGLLQSSAGLIQAGVSTSQSAPSRATASLRPQSPFSNPQSGDLYLSQWLEQNIDEALENQSACCPAVLAGMNCFSTETALRRLRSPSSRSPQPDWTSHVVNFANAYNCQLGFEANLILWLNRVQKNSYEMVPYDDLNMETITVAPTLLLITNHPADIPGDEFSTVLDLISGEEETTTSTDLLDLMEDLLDVNADYTVIVQEGILDD